MLYKQENLRGSMSLAIPRAFCPNTPFSSASHLRRTSARHMSVRGDASIGMLSGALGAELGKQDAQSPESAPLRNSETR